MLNCTIRLSGRIASQQSNNCLRNTHYNPNNTNLLALNDCRGVNGTRHFCDHINRQSVNIIGVHSNIARRAYISSNIIPPSNELIFVQSDRSYTSQTRTMAGNHLVNEKSPYLLQHAYNPVDWYPWGDEAINKAKAENKAIFLSVGYSTCHWCHVMEKESFEDPEVAAVMNRHFVNIKVDREERPDIDKIYMQYLLMSKGSGGWPMSVWLTPELTPITAGTYFPPTTRWGVSSFTTVLEKIAEIWQEGQQDVLQNGNIYLNIMKKSANINRVSESADISVDTRFAELTKIYERNIDDVWGGFGSSTKFPEVPKINLGFHAQIHKPESDLARLSLLTLRNIANGGIHDHVFGGFCRYAVDRQWHIPHFEKMLYDQGQLLTAYTNAYKITRDTFFLNVADKIYTYITRDLQHPSGGFYCGEDADSYRQHGDDEKIEGAFYAWAFDEIQQIFTQNAEKFDGKSNAFEIYCYFYGIDENGNVPPTSDPHGHLLDRNILRVRTTVHDAALKFATTADDVTNMLKIGNDLLDVERCKRPRPQLDTKIVTAWNGLTLSGLSILSTVQDSPRRAEYLNTARKLVDFIKKHAYNPETKKLIRSCYGENVDSDAVTYLDQRVDGFLDDYAFWIRGLIDFYMATLDIDALRWARDLQNTQDSLFWDGDKNGYFYTQELTSNSIVRLKDDSDGAEPCGNSVSASNLLFISAYFQEPLYKTRVKDLFGFFQTKSAFAYALPEMFSAQLMCADSLTMMVVVGPPNEQIEQMLNIVREYYIPGLILLHYNPNDKNQPLTRESISQFKMIRNEPTVYLCHNRVCQLPITVSDDLKQILKGKYLPITLQG